MILPRRAFLSQLVRLPLVGGSLSLIGAPAAVAEPVTKDLLRTYLAFVAREHVLAYWEWSGHRSEDGTLPAPLYWMPDHPTVEAAIATCSAASRASLVLAAAGVDRY